MRDEVIRSQPTDWREVVAHLLSPFDPDAQIQFQKQMSHHLLPDMGRDWFDPVTHAFLIRDPRPMLASLAREARDVHARRHGTAAAGRDLRPRRQDHRPVPAVVDAADLLAAPARVLDGSARQSAFRSRAACCEWPPDREPDGVWARSLVRPCRAHDRFEPVDSPPESATAVRSCAVVSQCRPLYEKQHRCRPLYENLRAAPTPGPGGIAPSAATLRRAQPRPDREHQRPARASRRGGRQPVRLGRAGRRRRVGRAAAVRRPHLPARAAPRPAGRTRPWRSRSRRFRRASRSSRKSAARSPRTA